MSSANILAATPTKNIKRLDFREHALLRPDYIIGDCNPAPLKLWLFDAEKECFVWSEVTVAKGLLVIIDEILSNATDRKDFGLSQIRIRFDATYGDITIKDERRRNESCSV
jgi:DNA gyrase/topoisomerase IV subunit B